VTPRFIHLYYCKGLKMTINIDFTGVFPILATPFDKSEDLNLEDLDRMVRFMAETGVDGVTILGVLGEAHRLTDRERETAIRTAVAAAGSMPVVVGASHRGTRAALELSVMASELGAGAVMITPHAEPAMTEARIFEHYACVADGCGLPIVVQDHPASTGVQMPVPLLLKLAAEIQSVACFKEEAVPTAPKIRALKAGLGRPVSILTGLGGLYGLFDLEAGSDGFMTGFAFPEVLQAMVAAARAGEAEEVARIYQRFLPLIVFEQQPGVAVRKDLLRRRGLLSSPAVRHPGGGLPPGAASDLESIVARVLPGVDLTRTLEVAALC
jgi:4-hydroxy-tetrahydrodipicolinate synthase